MRDDKDHNERLDDFSGYMRQRLEEHRLPVDAGCWDEVEWDLPSLFPDIVVL